MAFSPKAIRKAPDPGASLGGAVVFLKKGWGRGGGGEHPHRGAAPNYPPPHAPTRGGGGFFEFYDKKPQKKLP